MTYNILFKKFFVEPILSGQKTQTRRVEEQYVTPGDFLLARTKYFEKPFARLKVKAVRRERLLEIGLPDLRAEGVSVKRGTPFLDFSNIWDSINDKDGYRWDDNPKVTVIEFELMK